VRIQNAHVHRHRPLYVLFVHRDLGAIDNCLRELKKGQFTVSSEFVLNPAQCAAQLRSRSYDVIVVEYPSPACPRPHELQLLRKTLRETPLVLLTTGLATESRAELMASGAFEYVEREHIAQLPMAVRRALNDKKLREELEEVRQALQHSQSLYRALVDNTAYGIYRCDAQGNVLDVNQALVNMLGYASKDQLLSANQLAPIFPDLRRGSPFAQPAPDSKRIDPVETDWKRKDGTTLKARLSGLGVYDDQGNFAGHEIIVVDITEQRTLEEELRQQASTDSLTGLPIIAASSRRCMRRSAGPSAPAANSLCSCWISTD
jgi:PAS domain S-box-containing protein